jgi:CRP/FNR family cyclic AMP-dependent transcriptional regulator
MKESELGKTYKDGEIICREGDEGNSMFVIQSGTVEVSKNLPEGDMVLRTMTQGEIFGEIALFDRMARSATVKARGEAIVLRVDKKGFFAKACKDPTLTFNILEGMSKRIRDLTHELSKYKEQSELIL